MNRTRKSLHLSKTPLIFVLAQVRVSPIAKIESFLPSIQETLRHQRFPGLVKRNFRIEQVTPNGPQSSEDRVQWEFVNAERTRSVLIDDSSLVLQTTAYDSGESFMEHLRVALDAFELHAKPTEVVRIGLRYVDLVQPRDGLGFEQLVNPGLRVERALPLPGSNLSAQCEILRQTSKTAKLRVRYSEALEGLGFPADIGGFVSLMLREDPIRKTPFALLDTDHFDTQVTPFDVAGVLERTWALHAALIAAFQDHLVTPTALEAWK